MNKWLLSFLMAFACSYNANSQIDLYPGDNLQAEVDQHPAGTSFFLHAGEYRLQTITARSGDSFTGELGSNGERLAILKGSQVLENFTQANDANGNYWYSEDVIAMVSPNFGTCEPGFDCQRAEDIFIDGLPLIKVLSLAEMDTPSECFIDGGVAYFRTNPNGKLVEASVNKFAIRADRATPGSGNIGASNVTVKNLIVEQYANPAQHGAIHSGYNNQINVVEHMGHGWTIDNNESRYNHGAGLFIFTDGLMQNNLVHHNGQIGLRGAGDNVVIQNNEIHNNCEWAGYNWSWEGGGTKFVYSNSIQILSNYSHDNSGPGLWTDINNSDSHYEGNLCEDNSGPGIFHEISYNATIQCNTLINNWNENSGGNLYGGNIFISNSSEVEVMDNVCISSGLPRGNGIIVNCADRTNSAGEPYLTNNNYVHDNEIVYTTAANFTGGLIQNSCTEANGNVFENNSYHSVDENHAHFVWGPNGNATGDLSWFQSLPQGAGATIDENVEPPAISSCLVGCELTPEIILSNNTTNGVSSIQVSISILEISGSDTSGEIVLYMNKDNKLSLNWDPGLINSNGLVLSNANWSFDNSNPNYYLWTSSVTLAGNSLQSIGFTINLNPDNLDGQTELTVNLLKDSGGDTESLNNSDSAVINFTH